MISWRAYWCLGGAVIAGAAGALLAMFAVPLVPAVIGLALTTLAVITLTRPVVRHADALQPLSEQARQQAAGWITAGIVTHVVWVLLVVLRPDLWLVWAVLLAALCGVSNVVAMALTYHLTKIQPREQRQLEARRAADQLAILDPTSVAAGHVVEDPNDPAVLARRAFQLRGYGWLEIIDWTPIMSGDEPIGIAYRVRVPAATDSKDAHTKLSGADVEPLAIAFSKILGVQLETNWVHVKKEKAAGVYTVSVTTVDALAKVYPYEDRLEWTSIKTPAVIGHRIDGSVVTASLAQHWADTGRTRSGKTSLIHTKRAHITRSRDAVLAVGGVEKLFDSVGPWIEPYLGTDEELPFLAVANGPLDTAAMLACFMSVARWRQSVPHRQREGFVDIVVELDEASFFLVLNRVSAVYQGIAQNPTQLACAMVKGAGSAGVWLHVASQRGTNNNWGDLGGDISANIGTQTVFSTSDPGEVGRATGDWKTPPPNHPGEFLYTTGLGEPVDRLKAEYIQETDPQKPLLHDGLTLTDVAWSRRHFVRHLDPGSERAARAASDWYRDRPTRADDVYRYLTGLAVDLSQYKSAEYAAAFDEATARIKAKLAAAGIATKTAEQPPEPRRETASAAATPDMFGAPPDSYGGDNVMPMTRPKTLKVWIEEVVDDADEPLSRQGIITALAEAGYREGEPVNPQQVTNALKDLVDTGRLLHDVPNQRYESARISA